MPFYNGGIVEVLAEARDVDAAGVLAPHAKDHSQELDINLDSSEPVVLDEAICISSVYTLVRSERYKQLTQSKDMDGKTKDESIRRLISTYRRLDEINPDDFSSEEFRKAALLKDESATIVFGYMSPTIIALTQKYRGEWREVAQRGAELGFWQAFTRFDPSYENEFMTYAGQLAKGVMKRTLRDDTLRNKMYGRRTAEGTQAIRNLTDLGWSVERAQQMMGMSGAEHRELLDNEALGSVGTITPTSREGDSTEIVIESVGSGTEDITIANQTLQEMGRFLDNTKLSSAQEAVVTHIFGFRRGEDGNFKHIPGHIPDITDTEVAKLAGCSQSFVSRTKRDLSNLLRSAFESTN